MEDKHTNTVEDAAEFERKRVGTQWRELIEWLADDEEEADEDDDLCGCTDPGCPCEGDKKGSL